ncbi:Fe3+-siderophore ABC transporter permease [Virgibacillus halodenitrificans]|uniref:Fe3+-siderophore ABC transporter permease n=1 Tax=Virgibacillus halodenitrificans TaxID=1482 RepID=A0ABR7VKV6_VIRHA|nr:Fe3+-siderophore ABC transporter permease [Virgibacillus halodenitrificans]MBD1221901.1 Fe3+-siderophore ABC transporter permease [Virgibacillus halodenitrificans]
MGFVQVLFLILIWVLPILFLINAYLKMDRDEKQEIKNDIKNPLALFGIGFIIIGLLLFFSGVILTVKKLQHIGAIMVLISWITTSIVSWKRGKTGFITSVVLILLGVMGIAAYSYLI